MRPDKDAHVLSFARSVNGVCDYYGVDANNKLQWVNHNSTAAPTSGQTNPYMLFHYDANGNMTHRERQYGAGLFRSFDLLWDGDDRLRQVNELSPTAGTPFTASYDGDGLRVAKTENWTGSAQTHQYTWGPGGVVYDSLNSATYTPGSAQRVNGTDRFPAADWLGSARYLSDSSGNNFPSALRFDAFGNRSATGGTDPYDPSDFQFGAGAGYQTEYASTTEPGLGLQYLVNRYYDPAIGRFISPDPIGLGEYDYCDNDPVGLVDPSGLAPWYDQLHNYLSTHLEAGQAHNNDILASSGFGVVAATIVNTVAEVGFGIADLPAGIVHFPAAVRQWGTGTGEFAANPSLSTLPGVGQDLMILANLGLAAEGSVRGLGALADVIKVENPTFFTRCHRGSIRFGDSGINGEGGIPRDSFRGKSAPGRAAEHFEREHGIPRKTFGKVLHQIKRRAGLGGADDTAIDRAGNVYDDRNGEFLENIFDRIPGGGK